MLSKKFFGGLLISIATVGSSYAQSVNIADAKLSDATLPINVASQAGQVNSSQQQNAPALVSPSQPKNVPAARQLPANVNNVVPNTAAVTNANLKTIASSDSNSTIPPIAQQNHSIGNGGAAPVSDDFNFDLKMKSLNAPTNNAPHSVAPSSSGVNSSASALNDADLPKDIQYEANPVEALGNSILSQMDSDLFSKMSEIEKSTTLLTLELRREKIRNEIEAQKAIRQKNIDDQERLKEEQKLKDLERKKKIEAQVLQEKQALLDKEQLFEILKQRKLLNAYMNQMLVNNQEWLKEKESLYAQIKALEDEKKQLIELFKDRINKVLEASAKNIQVAEAARANFERIVKNLKSRNEQLRKRVEADAQIIKNAKNSLYLKSQSIEELKNKNAANVALAAQAAAMEASATTEELVEEEKAPEKLSAKYAILGISGQAGNMSVDIIDVDGQPISLKVGSPLPSGHVVSEIGADYVKFTRDGYDDYLYVGRSIDGYIPTLGLTDTKKK